MTPAATGMVAGGAPGGAAQGAAGLASLMSGRSTFGGNKRRRTTSTGHTMSEAQEGKVTGFTLCKCVFSLRLHESTWELVEPINHAAACSETRLVRRAGNAPQEHMKHVRK